MSAYGLRFDLDNDVVGPITILEDSPINWDQLDFEYRRDKKLLGIFRKFSSEIEFQGEGYDYVRNIYETQGPEALVTIEVFQRDPAQFDYTRIFTGRLNLDNYEEILQDGSGLKTVKTNIEEQNFIRKFLNNLKIKLDLFELTTLDGSAITPYTDEQVANFQLHSVTIPRSYESNASGNDDFNETFAFGNNFNLANPLQQFFQINLDNPIVEDLEEVFNYNTIISQRDGINNPNINPIEENRFFFRAQDFGSFQFIYDARALVEIIVDADGGANLFEFSIQSVLVLRRASDQSLSFDFEGAFASGPLVDSGSRQMDVTHNRTWDLEPGDEVFHYFQTFVLSNRPAGTNLKANASIQVNGGVNQNRLQISATTTFPDTDVTGMLMYEALNRVVEKITDTPDAIFSELFGRPDSEPTSYPTNPDFPNFGAQNMITNGYGLRLFPLTVRSLFTSFDELYNTIRPVFRAAVGYENINGEDKIRIETWQYFYQIENEIFNLGTSVSNFSKVLANEFRYQTVNIGYRNWEAKDSAVAGVDEFNSTRQYRLPINTSDAEFNLITNTVTSGYIVELKRREGLTPGVAFDQQPNNRYDENLFMINVVPNASPNTDWRSRKDEPLTSVQNFVDPDNIMNYKLSPATMMFTWLPWIYGSMYNNADQVIYFAEGTGNYRLITQGYPFVPNDTIDESADWPESQLEEQPRWLPEIYKFDAKLTFSNITQIDTNPNGVITFIEPIENVERKGFILKVSWNGDTRVASFELLRANENFAS